MKKAKEELTTASHKIAEEMYKESAAGAEAGQQAEAGAAGAEEEPKEKEDVVEAEFEEVDKDKNE